MKAYKKIRLAQSQLHTAQLTVTLIEASTTGATREQREHYVLLSMIRKMQGGDVSETAANKVGEPEQAVLRDLISTVYAANDTLTNFEGVDTYIRGAETLIIQDKPVVEAAEEVDTATDVEVIPPDAKGN